MTWQLGNFLRKVYVSFLVKKLHLHYIAFFQLGYFANFFACLRISGFSQFSSSDPRLNNIRNLSIYSWDFRSSLEKNKLFAYSNMIRKFAFITLLVTSYRMILPASWEDLRFQVGVQDVDALVYIRYHFSVPIRSSYHLNLLAPYFLLLDKANHFDHSLLQLDQAVIY